MKTTRIETKNSFLKNSTLSGRLPFTLHLKIGAIKPDGATKNKLLCCLSPKDRAKNSLIILQQGIIKGERERLSIPGGKANPIDQSIYWAA